jgi:hypothetical protein
MIYIVVVSLTAIDTASRYGEYEWELPVRTITRENERGNTVAGKDVKGIQNVLEVLVRAPIPDT